MRRWHKPIPMSRYEERNIPEHSGVYVLLEDAKDVSSIIKIAPARNLLRSFRREMMPADGYSPATPEAMMYFETVYEAEEAQKFLEEYRRVRGRRPILNSGY